MRDESSCYAAGFCEYPILEPPARRDGSEARAPGLWLVRRPDPRYGFSIAEMVDCGIPVNRTNSL